MHVYVQKSTSTTLPSTSAAVSGGEFSQPVAPPNPGRCPSTDNGDRPTWWRSNQLTSPYVLSHESSGDRRVRRCRASDDLAEAATARARRGPHRCPRRGRRQLG